MHIVIRTDASREIGTGHVMRCLSLANVLRENGADIYFVCREHDGNLCDLISGRGYSVRVLDRPASNEVMDLRIDHSTWLGVTWQHDAAETLAAIETIGVKPDWLIVDHYALNSSWETELRVSVGQIMVIDDLADRPHNCDLLLDQNFHQEAVARYAGIAPEHCKLLLGPRYALLRQEFRVARKGLTPREGPVERILVFFGGVDRANHTYAAVKALVGSNLDGIVVDVVIGGQHRRKEQIESICNLYDFELHVQTSRLAELMSKADVSIGAGGSATWERCCVGLPSLTFAVADNQHQIVKEAALAGLLSAPDMVPDDSEGLAAQLRTFFDNSLLRQSISQNSMSLVDGFGADRVRLSLGVFCVSVRAACEDDCERIFKWRNCEAVRGVSHDSAPLEWSTHCAWFNSVLSDPDRPLLIGESGGAPVGVVRFDIDGDAADLSIYLVPGQSNRGFGLELLLVAEQWMRSIRSGLGLFRAEVLFGNDKSHRLFVGAGYCFGTTTYTKRLS